MLDYVVKLPGVDIPITFSGLKARIANSQEPSSVTVVSEGPIKGTWSWNLQSQGNETLVTVEGNYQMDTSIISSALGDGAVGKGVAKVTDTLAQIVLAVLRAHNPAYQEMLANLKEKVRNS
jgi:hypothetical protein